MQLNHLPKALCIALVLAFGGSLASGGPPPSRNWVSHPAVVQVDGQHLDLYAIGDVHADADRLLGVLVALNAIRPETPTDMDNTKWKMAPRSILVVTGDMIDKGPRPGGSSLRVISLLRALQDSGPDVNSQVILLMGNHEAEFLAKWDGNKTDEFRRELEVKESELKRDGKVEEAKAFNPQNVANCQGDLGQFLCNLPIAAKVKDWFFSHAGNTNGRTIAALSADIEAGFASKGFATPELIGEDSILEARLNSKGCGRKPWFYDCGRQTDAEFVLRRNATALGVNHIVQGHQPGEVKFNDGVKREEGAVFQRYGLLFLIDTGMSRGIEGNEDGKKSVGGGLSIIRNPVDENVTLLCAKSDGKLDYDSSRWTGLWSSTEKQPIAARQCR
ncbi:MAG: hypothetical protein QOH88_2773 [Verrucomicrobiota bacterium]